MDSDDGDSSGVEHVAEGGEVDVLEEVSRTRQLRLNLARELHDQVAQNLAAVLVNMELLKSEQVGRDRVQQQLSSLQRSVRQTLDSVRGMLLTLRELPQEESDFFADLRARLLPEFERESGIRVSVHVSTQWPAVLPMRTATHLRRILLEALRNARQHSGASSVHITFRRNVRGRLMLTVKDDGRGFYPADVAGTVTLGVLGMRERATLLGGTLAISSRPGQGTTVEVTVDGVSAGRTPGGSLLAIAD